MNRMFEEIQRRLLERSEQSRMEPEESRPQMLTESDGGLQPLSGVRTVRAVLRPESRLVAYTDEHSLGAEKFRLLATRLKCLQQQQRTKRILVTSSMPEDGKSLVASNLAITLARHTGQKVLLLEGDLHRPAVARLLGLGKLRGLDEYLLKKESLAKVLYHLENLQLWFLPGGTAAEQPLALLQTTRLSELLDQCTHWFDWIVIDSPPLMPLTDASWWARLSDGCLMVVRQGVTPKFLVEKSMDRLDNAPLLGVVLNDAMGAESRYYGKYYRYYGNHNKR